MASTSLPPRQQRRQHFTWARVCASASPSLPSPSSYAARRGHRTKASHQHLAHRRATTDWRAQITPAFRGSHSPEAAD
eukprot:4504105-Prymnesium_polylepis.1